MICTLLTQSFQLLDRQIGRMQQEYREQGALPPVSPGPLRIVGQVALLLADLPFPVVSTMDLDLLHQLPFQLQHVLENVLLDVGLTLDSDQHLIWMPADTVYHPFFPGRHLHVVRADPLYVMASKCKFKRSKDRVLIQHYFQWQSAAEEQIQSMGIATKWVHP